uniref:F-box domain-containing protein n=1 Tax=Nelumbo nucifera TaxID=4432 RepID=A0A822ZIP5_NELNU|nr:TPA_asm: hypothetical protein HUJ06_001575 [Nelumbo nucifera]
MEEANRWEKLNVDCLVNIFERVDMDDLLLSLPFVCKSWYQASLHPSCWKVVHFHKLINQQHSESG